MTSQAVSVTLHESTELVIAICLPTWEGDDRFASDDRIGSLLKSRRGLRSVTMRSPRPFRRVTLSTPPMALETTV